MNRVRSSCSKVSGCRWQRAGPPHYHVCSLRQEFHKILHKSFRWRISQTIRFRKYGMCCCKDTDTLLIFTLVGTLLLFPYSLSSYSFQPTDAVTFLVFQTAHSWLHVAFSSRCSFLLFPLCGRMNYSAIIWSHWAKPK